MGTYKEDSDRFHEMREERDRELAEAATLEDFLRRLEQRGVDVKEMMGYLDKARAGLDRAGVDPAFGKELMIKAIRMRLGKDA
jgi:hypothetical protein